MQFKLIIKPLPALFMLLTFFCTTVYSANINPGADGHQWAFGENIGWHNFEPSLGSGVTVGDSTVEGFVWAENIGWINLGPMGYGGVINDGSGNLSGWAWGENVGWISFSCTDTGTCAAADNYGVKIASDGMFSGYAWGENIGWINFDFVSQSAYRVQTSWEPVESTTTTTTTPGTTTTAVSTTTTPGTTTTAVSTTTTPSTTTTTATITLVVPCPITKTLGENNPNVVRLRAFRDSKLAKSAVGRRIIQIYYNNAEGINAALERSPALQAVARRVLEAIAPMVGKN